MDPTEFVKCIRSTDSIVRESFVTRSNSMGCSITLSKGQNKLLQEIKKHFDPEENNGDLLILYEMTGFQVKSEDNKVFWSQYAGDHGFEAGQLIAAQDDYSDANSVLVR